MSWLGVERDGHIVTVTLDRPPVNAVDNDVLAEIAEVFGSFEADRGIRVAIFTAAGDRAFMGGADLNSVGSRDRSDAVPLLQVEDDRRKQRRHHREVDVQPHQAFAASFSNNHQFRLS